MENIVLLDYQEDLSQFLAMEDGVLKNIYYHRNISGRSYIKVNVCKKEGNFYYSETVYKVKRSTKNSYYLISSGRKGFTMNSKGKIDVWFGSDIYKFSYLNKLYEHLNFNWVESHFYPYITKTILGKMICGKITNPVDLCKAYLKSMRITASPRMFYKVANLACYNKPNLLRLLSIAANHDHCLELLYNIGDNPYDSSYNLYNVNWMYDMVDQAHMLNKKVNFNWSAKRFREVHTEWSREIMKHELSMLKNTSIKNAEFFTKFDVPGFTLLKKAAEVFEEGTEMKHCLYTSYWSSMERGSYLAYKVEIGIERATLGLSLSKHQDKFEVTYNQCYAIGNREISLSLKRKVNKFVDHLNNKFKKHICPSVKETYEQLEEIYL